MLPRRPVVDGGEHVPDPEVAGPGMTAHQDRLAERPAGAGLGERDERLHEHGPDDAHVAVGDRRARRDGAAGHAVGLSAHLRAVVHAVAHENARQPLTADGPGPAPDHEPQGKTVQRLERCAVHGPCDQRLGLERLGDGHAAGDGLPLRVSREVRVGGLVGDVDGVVGDPAVVEHIAQPDPGPARAGDGAGGPGVAGRGWGELRSAVAAALELKLQGVMLEPVLEFPQGQSRGPDAGLAGQLQRPLHGVDAARVGRDAVVADEHPRGRRDGVVEQVGRSLRIQRAFAEYA